jgi:hypothetical protein
MRMRRRALLIATGVVVADPEGQHVQGPFLVPAEYEARLGAFFDAALGD